MRIIRKKLIKHKRIAIGDIAISYLIIEGTSQDAPTMLFIHGFPFNKNMWIPQLSAIPREMTGIAIDLRGHGNTTMGHGFFSIDVFANDLLVFLQKLEIKNVIVCGVSMGGYVALRAHQINPKAFSGMILSDTHARADQNENKWQRFETIQSVLKHGTRPFSIHFVSQVFSPHSILHQENAVELIKSSIRRNNVRSICATLLALASRSDTSAHLPHIKVPVLLIRGAEDRITPRELMEELHQNIPQSTYVELAGCGHLPNLEDRHQFNQLIFDFIHKNKNPTL